VSALSLIIESIKRLRHLVHVRLDYPNVNLLNESRGYYKPRTYDVAFRVTLQSNLKFTPWEEGVG
jgi:hypothetical protein